MNTSVSSSASMIYTSTDAKIFFLNKTGLEIDFYPFIINFHKQDKVISSLCWKGKHPELKNDTVISAIQIPLHVIKETEKIEYIPLNKGDTVIIRRRVFTIDEESEDFRIVELPYIFSEKHAISIANILSNSDTSEYFWRIYKGTNRGKFVCYVWIGLSIDMLSKSFMLPVFIKDAHLMCTIDDFEPISISDMIIQNGSIYQIDLNNYMFELKYLCSIFQSQPS